MPSKDARPFIVNVPQQEAERFDAAVKLLANGDKQARSRIVRELVYAAAAAAEAKQEAQPVTAEA